jgi:hypothetical protein
MYADSMLLGVLALLAGIAFLVTLAHTCRFKREEEKQDTLATVFQDGYHISFFASMFLIAMDQLNVVNWSTGFGSWNPGPTAVYLAGIAASVCWCGYRMRRVWIIRAGNMLTPDLKVVPRETYYETIAGPIHRH